jgi:tetratricopeptide (TPR) repeat protein
MGRNLNKNQPLLICLALTVVTIAVYYHLCTYDFVSYDDLRYVCKNSNIQTGITLKTLKWAFTSGYAGNWHPLTWLSHMLDWQLFGSNAGGHHTTNLIFHIANTLLLFLVLKKMTGMLWPSAFVAAMFALHPLHVESVAWVSERKDVLSAFFWILTMWAYACFVSRPKIWRYLLVAVFFALGLMAKPMLVTLPFVLLLLDYWPLNRLQNNHFGRLVLEKIPFFVLSAASIVVTFLIQRTWGAVATITAVPLQFRVSNALISYVKYIDKMVWPVNLAIFYPHPVLNASFYFAILSAVLLLAVTFLILRLAANHRYLVTGWFWYIGTLVPVIGLVQVGSQAMADRYSYITLTGLFIIIAWGLPDLLGKWPNRKIVLWGASLMVLSALAMRTYFQQQYWKNSITLGQHTVDVTEDNYVAHFGLSEDMHKQGRLDEAMYHCLEAVRIRPNSLEADTRMGNILQSAGRFDEAVKMYRKCLQREPNNPNMLNDTGVALGLQGKFDEAVEYLTKALKIKPDFAAAHANLGYTLSIQGNLNESVIHFDEALRLDPDFALAHYQLGQVLVRMGEINGAIVHFNRAIQIDPDFTDAKNDLNSVLAEQQKFHGEDAENAKK